MTVGLFTIQKYSMGFGFGDSLGIADIDDSILKNIRESISNHDIISCRVNDSIYDIYGINPSSNKLFLLHSDNDYSMEFVLNNKRGGKLLWQLEIGLRYSSALFLDGYSGGIALHVYC